MEFRGCYTEFSISTGPNTRGGHSSLSSRSQQNTATSKYIFEQKETKFRELTARYNTVLENKNRTDQMVSTWQKEYVERLSQLKSFVNVSNPNVSSNNSSVNNVVTNPIVTTSASDISQTIKKLEGKIDAGEKALALLQKKKAELANKNSSFTFGEFSVGVLKGFNEGADQVVYNFVNTIDKAVQASLSPIETAEKVRKFFAEHSLQDITKALKIYLGEQYDNFLVASFEDRGKMFGKFAWDLFEAAVTGPYCFTEGTMILTSPGKQVAIEKLQIMDEVLSCNLGGDRCEKKKVKSISHHVVNQLYILTIQKQNGVREEIQVTGEHPFYVKEKGWVKVAYLTEADELVSLENKSISILSKRQINGEFTVYNMAVKGNQNYYVGENSVLVHNCASFVEGVRALELVENTSKAIAKLGLQSKEEIKEFRRFYINMAKNGELGAINPDSLIDAWNQKKIGSVGNAAAKLGLQTSEEISSYNKFIGRISEFRTPDPKNIADFERFKAALAVEEIKGAKVIGSALKDDVYHRSASWMLDEAAEKGRLFSFKGGDGRYYNLLQVEGGLNGDKGIYEWLVDRMGNLNHQRFIKNGRITGLPNQIVK